MSYEKHFRVEPGSKLQRITKLQRALYADRSHSLLIVLQGIDGAGKDGTCWHVIKAMDPQGVNVTGFKQPTEGERDHDFLWRVHPHARDAEGSRSSIGLTTKTCSSCAVHKLAPKKVWKPRYDFINDWEKLLAEENNTTILKFFLFISKEEQLARFKARLDNPAHQWKISASDYAERDKWDDYIEAFEAAMERCSRKYAPWFRHSVQPQMVPEPRRVVDYCRRA